MFMWKAADKTWSCSNHRHP